MASAERNLGSSTSLRRARALVVLGAIVSAPAVVAIAAAAIGCIAVVDVPSTLSGNCSFEGQTATCGSCILAECSAAVDACCIETECSGSMGSLDACATRGGRACESVAFPISSSKASVALASCIRSRCAACGDLGSGSGASATSCSASGGGCSCRIPSGSTGSNETHCSPSVQAEAICCADLDWPLAGTSCQCGALNCSTSSNGNGCTCNTFGDGPLASCSRGGNCCAGPSDCTCGSGYNLCSTGLTSLYRSVPSCSAAAIGCGSSRRRIAQCSAR